MKNYEKMYVNNEQWKFFEKTGRISLIGEIPGLFKLYFTIERIKNGKERTIMYNNGITSYCKGIKFSEILDKIKEGFEMVKSSGWDNEIETTFQEVESIVITSILNGQGLKKDEMKYFFAYLSYCLAWKHLDFMGLVDGRDQNIA